MHSAKAGVVERTRLVHLVLTRVVYITGYPWVFKFVGTVLGISIPRVRVLHGYEARVLVGYVTSADPW